MATLAARTAILKIIDNNDSIVDVSALQDALAQIPDLPTHLEHQQEKMRSHWAFLETLVLGRDDLSVQLQQAKVLLELPVFPSNEVLWQFFSDLFVEADLWEAWIQHLDESAAQSSLKNLRALDRAASAQTDARKCIVIIGGGPLSSLLASILAPFYRITLITMERVVAMQWRSRDMWLNSTCTIQDPNGVPLPLKDGPTTRVIARMIKGIRMGLDVDVLCRRDALTIPCELGTATYPWGPHFGQLIAHNILMNVENIMTHQWVDMTRMTQKADGTIKMVLTDVDTMEERSLEAFAVFVLTGPGPEATKVADERTKREYAAAAMHVDNMLRLARTKLAQQCEAVRLAQVGSLDFQSMRKNLAHDEATRIALSLQRNLPNVITLTTIQKVREIWFELCQFDVPPEAYPLAPVFSAENAIAYVGNANTMQTVKACIDGNVLDRAYPQGIRPTGSRRAVIYNVPQTTAEEYNAVTRRRYWGTFTSTTETLPYKASRYRSVYDAKKQRDVVEVTHFDANGKRSRRRYNYVVDATGLDRSPLEERLPAEFGMQTIYDLDGFAVARGNRDRNLFIAGSATGTKAPAFPAEIQRILDALGISDNTVAQWALAPSLERLGYSFLLSQCQAR